jgi:hypothetical protein
MTDALRHNINLVTPGLNFWGDQNDASKSVVDKTKWIMQTAADCIEKLEDELHHCFHRINELQAALREIIQEDALTGKTVFVGDFGKIARKALDGKNDPQTDL